MKQPQPASVEPYQAQPIEDRQSAMLDMRPEWGSRRMVKAIMYNGVFSYWVADDGTLWDVFGKPAQTI